MRLRVPLLPWWVRWAAVAGLVAFIFYTSIVTVPPETVVDQTNPGLNDAIQIDKWRHFVAYATLGYALAYATADWNLETRSLVALVVGTAVLYGLGIEFGQSLVPERYFSVADAAANALGGLLVLPWYALSSRFEFVSLRAWAESVARRLQPDSR